MKKQEPNLLMSKARIQRAVNRIAYQVVEDNRQASKMLIIGLKDRGFAVAQLLATELSSVMKQGIKLVHFTVDEENGWKGETENNVEARKDCDYILLVDDVIFSGQTMLGAIQKISGRYNPSTLRTVVLIDRGHRKTPVEASFYGIKLPTKLNEHVSLNLSEGVPEEVVLINKTI